MSTIWDKVISPLVAPTSSPLTWRRKLLLLSPPLVLCCYHTLHALQPHCGPASLYIKAHVVTHNNILFHSYKSTSQVNSSIHTDCAPIKQLELLAIRAYQHADPHFKNVPYPTNRPLPRATPRPKILLNWCFDTGDPRDGTLRGPRVRLGSLLRGRAVAYA